MHVLRQSRAFERHSAISVCKISTGGIAKSTEGGNFDGMKALGEKGQLQERQRASKPR
jgi:hypothetical protein